MTRANDASSGSRPKPAEAAGGVDGVGSGADGGVQSPHDDPGGDFLRLIQRDPGAISVPVGPVKKEF